MTIGVGGATLYHIYIYICIQCIYNIYHPARCETTTKNDSSFQPGGRSQVDLAAADRGMRVPGRGHGHPHVPDFCQKGGAFFLEGPQRDPCGFPLNQPERGHHPTRKSCLLLLRNLGGLGCWLRLLIAPKLSLPSCLLSLSFPSRRTRAAAGCSLAHAPQSPPDTAR